MNIKSLTLLFKRCIIQKKKKKRLKSFLSLNKVLTNLDKSWRLKNIRHLLQHRQQKLPPSLVSGLSYNLIISLLQKGQIVREIKFRVFFFFFRLIVGIDVNLGDRTRLSVGSWFCERAVRDVPSQSWLSTVVLDQRWKSADKLADSVRG